MDKNPSSALTADEIEKIETWIFDLDNTLYPASSRLFDQVDRNITLFIMKNFDLEWDDAYRMQKSFFREHGTTMCGLMTEYGTDPADFLAFVHDIDLSPISPNPGLTSALERLPGRKVIFTNGSTDHAENITRHMEVDHHFDGIFDIIDSGYTPKPAPEVYDKMTEHLKIDPKTAIMVEDMARNLVPAAAMGMITVWVRTDTQWAIEGSEGDHIDHIVDDLAGWLNGLTTR